jgi:peroxiredoxin
MRNVDKLPANLPMPQDDGMAAHLTDHMMPNISLPSTSGKMLNLGDASTTPMVLFIYPRAGSPIAPNTNTEGWDLIPGARGCTPHACGYRDLYQDFINMKIRVFGLSIQSPNIQKEFVDRMHIPFEILSDQKHELITALRLPTFEFEGELLIKRMALIIDESKIQKVFYPVFPPDKNAVEVLGWLKENNQSR